jgi:methionyl-tRNA formyltransferase
MKPEDLRIAFAGTPDFAATALDAMVNRGLHLCGVLTQPDRPAGRGRKLQPSSVKKRALAHCIPLCQPISLRDPATLDAVATWQPQVLVVAAYGLILPKHVLGWPDFGCLNIHASLLPRWRGAAPIHRAIEAGDPHTGISIMQMDAGLDTGPVGLEKNLNIRPEDTTSSLHDRLAELGGDAIIEALELLCTDRWHPVPQNEQECTYAHKVRREDGVINWTRPVDALERQIRAMHPWPGTWCGQDNRSFRIHEARIVDATSKHSPTECGLVLGVDPGGIKVACGQGALSIQRLQTPGSKPMNIASFINGHPDAIKPGMQL